MIVDLLCDSISSSGYKLGNNMLDSQGETLFLYKQQVYTPYVYVCVYVHISCLVFTCVMYYKLMCLCLCVYTIGRSLRIWIPSPGPMWATWLKLVGLEINLFLISGSRSISLETHTQKT